jgi:hypothetical protein
MGLAPKSARRVYPFDTLSMSLATEPHKNWLNWHLQPANHRDALRYASNYPVTIQRRWWLKVTALSAFGCPVCR